MLVGMKKGVLSIITASAMWGSVSIFLALLAKSGMSRLQIIWLRSLTASLLLFVLGAVQKQTNLRIRLKDWWIFFGNGIIAMTAFSICYWEAMSMVGVAVSAVLIYTAPIFSLLLSRILFKEQINRRCLTALCLSIAGVALVSGVGEGAASASFPGILLGLLGGFFYATQTIFGKFAVERQYGSMTVTVWSALLGGIVLTPLALQQKLPEMFFSSVKYPLILVALSVVCTVVPCSLFIIGLKSVSAGRASMLTSSEPGVALLISCLVFREKLKLAALVGILLVITAVCLISTEKSKDLG